MDVRRGREFIGLPVIDGETGESLGEVSDLLFAPDRRLAALVVATSKGLLRREKVFDITAFERIDAGGARLAGAAGGRDRGGRWATGLYALLAKNDGLCGRLLVDAEGKEVGVVGDVVLESVPLTLWGFEVSDGILRDILDGRPVIEAEGCVIEPERIVLAGPPGRKGDT